MGLILDSSLVIAAERRHEPVSQFLRSVELKVGDQRIGLSSVGLTELIHAIYRAQTPTQRVRRETFISDLVASTEVLPYTQSTAFLAGRIDAEARSRGAVIPTMDLLIGVTALEFGYAVATVNLRHFQMIPGLKVLTL